MVGFYLIRCFAVTEPIREQDFTRIRIRSVAGWIEPDRPRAPVFWHLAGNFVINETSLGLQRSKTVAATSRDQFEPIGTNTAPEWTQAQNSSGTSRCAIA